MPLKDLIKQVYESLHKMPKSLLPIKVYYHTDKNNTLTVETHTSNCMKAQMELNT